MIKVRGYVSSRKINNNFTPQQLQNMAIRDYCARNKLHYLLSAVEYAMKNSYHMLNDLAENLSSIDGIVAFSIFQLPHEKKDRFSIYKKILREKKSIYFAIEGLKISKFGEIEKIEQIMQTQTSIDNNVKSEEALLAISKYI